MSFTFDSPQAEFIFRHAEVPMMIVGKDNRILEANDAISQDLGYARSDFLKMPGGWVDITHPDDIESDTDEVQRAIETGLRYTMDKRYKPKHLNRYVFRTLVVIPYTNSRGDEFVFLSQITHPDVASADTITRVIEEAVQCAVTKIMSDIIAGKMITSTPESKTYWVLTWWPIIKWVLGLLGICLTTAFVLGQYVQQVGAAT